MKQFTIIVFITLVNSSLWSQTNIGATLASSKSDQHMETLWFQYQLNSRFSFGAQYRNSGINYRFINAIAIEEGNAQFFGATLGYRIYQSDQIRLDFNFTTSYRMLTLESHESLPSRTGGLEFDPNFITSLKVNDKTNFHSGVMFRMTSQLAPEAIGDEQFFSAILLNALSYQVGINTLALRAYYGPMAGASGDTEKFYWQASVGFQHNFGLKAKDQTFTYFNF